MGRKRLKPLKKTLSDSRQLLRRSPRLNPLARPPQPPLLSNKKKKIQGAQKTILKQKLLKTRSNPKKALSDSRHLLRQSPRLNPLARPPQPHLLSNKQKKGHGAQKTTLKQKLAKTKTNTKMMPKPRSHKNGEKDSIAVPQITNSKDTVFPIFSLPTEIIIQIFGCLPQNELGRVARVCKMFHEYTRSAVLWRKVDVKLSRHMGSQSEITSSFIQQLSSSVIHLKLDFVSYSWNWKIFLNFEHLCMSLRGRCAHLHTLILHHALISDTLPSVVDLCSQFFPNLKTLILSKSAFGPNYTKTGYMGFPKIEALAVFQCGINGRPSYTFPKIPHLKKLNFVRTSVSDRWFLNNDDAFSLQQLEILHMGNSQVSYKVFRVLKSRAVNLTELSLCYAKLIDIDFSSDNIIFPCLKTICLRCCPFISCEGVVNLVRSCQSLQNIYVDRDVAAAYANHSFVAANLSKLEIVKAMDSCDHFREADYLLG